MHVDSIISDANSNRLFKEHEHLFQLCRFEKRDRLTIIKMLSYFETFGIEVVVKPDKKKFAMGQVSFFKMIDFMALVRMRTYAIEAWFELDSHNPDAETYWDPFDIQPFRTHLFNTTHATTELNELLAVLGYHDDNCTINNYDNTIEFQNNTVAGLLLTIGYWLEEWEQTLESYQLYDMVCKYNERGDNVLWSRHALDWMWKRQKALTISHGGGASI